MSEPLAVEETLWARWGRRAVTLPLYHAQWQRIDAWISAYANPTGAPRVGFENDAHRALKQQRRDGMSEGMKRTPRLKVVKTHDAYPLRTVAAMQRPELWLGGADAGRTVAAVKRFRGWVADDLHQTETELARIAAGVNRSA